MSQETKLIAEQLGRDALERVQPKLAALGAERLLTINVNIRDAVALALRAAPHIQASRAEIARSFQTIDVSELDFLEEYAWALGQAHRLYLARVRELHDSLGTEAELRAIRTQLLEDTAGTQTDSLREPASEVQHATNPFNLARDMILLATVMKQNWSNIQHQCKSTLADLDRSILLAEEILQTLWHEPATGSPVARAEDTRRRAFTLFVQAYEQARSVVHYMRWREGDAEQLLPALEPSASSRRYSAPQRAAPSNDAEPDTARLALTLMDELLEDESRES